MVKPGKLINQSKPNLFFKLFYQVKYYDYESPVKVGNSSTGLSLNALFRVEPNTQNSSYTLNMTIQLTGLTDSALFSTSIQTSLDNTFTEYLYQRINYPLENLELPILDQIRNQTDDRVKNASQFLPVKTRLKVKNFVRFNPWRLNVLKTQKNY